MTINNIVLFDGVCNLCSGFVQFVIKREKNSNISFASLQSEEGRRLLKEYGVDSSSVDSIVFIKNEKAYIKSKAFFEIIQNLKAPWPLLRIFSFLPLRFNNAVYDLIAKNRYKMMGKKESCWLPSKSMSNRFIDTIG
ncbi:thiol-disulfide oxidoreductase DCC family protein [Flagellimonas okinawensis]|uniref:Thiol-disulfide oxidoreductase DCC family protein n=1 Tax=Flagellimonas okinawensis TaxID=3031324 RepID=A0ABT5XQM2_9FLAO|nr:thiol-disulfide oxidoreductase DCC family protein [[Muricauda] okinawensis]MDF0708203.1 thiol-disulfide oxidoreductase DCC family protein [[Muricauda] okinawensis]